MYSAPATVSVTASLKSLSFISFSFHKEFRDRSASALCGTIVSSMYCTVLITMVMMTSRQVRAADAGLARLEHMYSVANAEEKPIEIDAVKVDDVTQCYMPLRQLDSRNTASRKFIVLDLSTNYAVQSVLKQVNTVCLQSPAYFYQTSLLSRK